MGRKQKNEGGSIGKSISTPVALYTPQPNEDEAFMDRLEAVAKKNGVSVSELTVQLWKDHVKKHGSGNAQYGIDQWFGNSDMAAYPAFMEDFLNIWIPYMQSAKDDDLNKMLEQAKKVMVYSAAYLETPVDKRAIHFGDMQTAREVGKWRL